MTFLVAAFVLSQPSFAQTQEETQIAIRNVIRGRTGKNGYEEFLDASALIFGTRIGALVGYANQWLYQGKRPTDAELPNGVSPDGTLLDVYRLINKEGQPLVALLERGSQKPVSFPEPVKVSLGNPNQYAFGFYYLGIMLRCMATADFADGHGSQGAARVILGLRFARQMQTGSIAHASIGAGLELEMLGLVERFLFVHPAHFAPDTLRLPDNLPYLLGAFDGEAAMCRSKFFDFLDDPRVFQVRGAETMVEAGKKVSASRAAEIYDSHLRGIENAIRFARKRLEKPENTWLIPAKESFGFVFPPSSGLEDEERKLVDMFLLAVGHQYELQLGRPDPFRRFLTRFAVSRVQQRILVHTAAVAKYKLEHGVFPSGLDKVYGKQPLDLINGQPYRMTIFGDTAKITLDVKDLGRIGLTGLPPEADLKKVGP